jgi:copper homeostasis protein
MTAVELAVQDVAGIAVAARVRPDRIELCSALAVGGLTPSRALIEEAVAGPVPVHVLVRPRAGDFAYDREERRLIVRDARHAVEAGAAGVVAGGTAGDGPDLALIDELRQAIGGAELTFHRAFDTLPDRVAALVALTAHGVARILTSGGADRADRGLLALAELADRAAGSIQVMAGGGVTAENAPAVLATGVDAVHGSAKRIVTGATGIALGSAAGAGPTSWETTDEDSARAFVAAVRGNGR